MSYPLRLPPELDAEARKHAQRLGISLNALIAVALDTYFLVLESVAQPGATPVPAKAAARGPKQPEHLRAAPSLQRPSETDAERAKRLGIPRGMEGLYDLDAYEESFGPDAQPESPEDVEALVAEFEATMQRKQLARSKAGRKKAKPPSPRGPAGGSSVH